jgi:Uri superfamily endonuclease
MAEWRERRKCVMAFEAGPESAVCTPGEREREVSREVAKVRVMKGFGGGDEEGAGVGGR